MKLRGLIVLGLLMVSLPSCKIATIRSLDEDEEAKAGFSATDYVASIWDEQLIPTFQEKAIEVSQLIQDIKTDEEAAIAAHGSRSGTGEYSFMVFGEAQAMAYTEELRVGRIPLDFAPYDGQPDASLLTGPVIPRRNNALRDSVGFIDFNNFVNQTEFAEVSSALKDYVIENVIRPLDLTTLEGKTLTFYGAFSLSDPNEIEIVPVSLEVQN